MRLLLHFLLLGHQRVVVLLWWGLRLNIADYLLQRLLLTVLFVQLRRFLLLGLRGLRLDAHALLLLVYVLVGVHVLAFRRVID